jgi:predicted amidophosphoribosyltransferase
MSDESQIHIPPSFEAVYRDARGRMTVSRVEFQARYELCEDMAQLLVEPSQAVHHDQGVDEDAVLARTRAGLASQDAGFSQTEAVWVVTRLAELLGWACAGLAPAQTPLQTPP